MNILVTGALGFIGRALTQDLCGRGFSVYCLDCRKDDQAFAGLPIKEFFIQDISQPFCLNQSFDHVFHLSGLNITHVGEAEYESYHRINVQGTRNLIEAVTARKFVFMSTAKVYQKQRAVIDEQSSLKPEGNYERSKWEAEKVCQEHFSDRDLTIFRSVNIVGPGQAEKAVIPVFFKSALQNDPLDIIYSPQTSLQILDVRDLIEAFSLLIKKGEGLGIINLCSDETVTLRELAEKIIVLCGSKSQVRCMNNSRASFSMITSKRVQTVLGWQPRIAIDDILKNYYASVSPSGQANKKEKILICGILPPPLFGHSAMYKILMESNFVENFDITFLNMKFWSYGQHKKVNFVKLLKLVKYLFQYMFLIAVKRPRYVLYNMSFDKMPFPKDFLFCFIGKICGCRIVLHDMGQYASELYQSSGGIYRGLIRWLLKNTTACILLGEGTKKTYNGFIDPRRLYSVPGSVEDTKNITIPDDLCKRSDSRINVLYFSFMQESKGVFTAFEAASKVLRENSSVHFDFGGPMASASVRRSFDKLQEKFGERVQHLGYIGDTVKRAAVYRNADIFIFPTYRDVFGLVLLHAMAEGVPVIASIEGTIPEIIKDGENGFLIDKGNNEQLAQRILQLASDRDLRIAMGESNRRRYCEVYVPERYGRRMIQVFNEIIKMD